MADTETRIKGHEELNLTWQFADSKAIVCYAIEIVEETGKAESYLVRPTAFRYARWWNDSSSNSSRIYDELPIILQRQVSFLLGKEMKVQTQVVNNNLTLYIKTPEVE